MTRCPSTDHRQPFSPVSIVVLQRFQAKQALSALFGLGCCLIRLPQCVLSLHAWCLSRFTDTAFRSLEFLGLYKVTRAKGTLTSKSIMLP
ncbi:hypothetical protein HYDPIDRAFT_115054 [Hydnomerulius pinastri MD-312]|uniref:Uncharacterized protein n=1 Tax=Hydnomerulius pinastri MD-312 TaxID=994086 RepID=A0A0C9WCI9_9AGAM|nr:hypothetical protein HYDPIDRAFT_115054 [Hydnomerulius pinastri MD-312]